jgi:hypothetical protein
MGEMVHDNVFWDRTAKESAMFMFLSYSWNLGGLRELGGGLKDLPKLVSGGNALNLQGGSATSTKIAYTLALPFVYGTTAAFYQYLKTGKPPESPRDLMYPRTGGKDPRTGEEYRAAAVGNMKDLFEAGQKTFVEGAPADMVTNKMSPAFTSMQELYSTLHGMGGSDWADMPFVAGDPRNSVVENTPSQIWQLTKHVAGAFEPIALKNLEGRKKGSGLSTAETLLGLREAGGMVQNPAVAEAKKQKAINERMKRAKRFDVLQEYKKQNTDYGNVR